MDCLLKVPLLIFFPVTMILGAGINIVNSEDLREKITTIGPDLKSIIDNTLDIMVWLK